jgi:Helix-turn-helix domain
MADADKLLTPAEAAAHLGGCVSESTLAKYRTQGVGPAYVKIGVKVRYRISTLDAWILSRERDPACHSASAKAARIGGIDSRLMGASMVDRLAPRTDERPSGSSVPSGQKLTVSLVGGSPQVRRVSRT